MTLRTLPSRSSYERALMPPIWGCTESDGEIIPAGMHAASVRIGHKSARSGRWAAPIGSPSAIRQWRSPALQAPPIRT